MIHSDGNALFLILIAVALFAALSYAVTQSGRGGGGTDKETALIQAGEITQFGNAVRTAATRMILTGTDAASVEFCSTISVFDFCQSVTPCEDSATCVFAPAGGGVAISSLPNVGGTWSFYEVNSFGNNAMDGIGTTGCGAACSDAFILVQNVGQTVCEALNNGYGLSISPIASDNDGVSDNLLEAYPGEPYFCYNDDGVYYYAHALIER